MIEGRGTVFVVDDDLSVRRGLERLLRSAGLRVQTFATARDFLEGGRLDGPGCLVLDVRMPGKSGLDLHEMLVAGGHSIPVVFITGHGDVPVAVRARKGGAVDILPKPFDDQAFLHVVRQAIARAG
jgi:two-component system, LuxR family, response regulator FixJ